MQSAMISVKVILLLLTVQAAAASRAIPSAVKVFEAARAIGEKVVVPLCQAHLCNGTEGTKEQACSCDATCHRRRDCCLDVFTDEQVRGLLDTDLWVCRTSPKGRGPYAVIGRCPKNWTDNVVRDRCENPKPKPDDPNSVLAITSISTNLTYGNIFCAHCNEGKIQPGQFQVKFRCNGHNVTDIQSALKDKECDAHLEELGLENCERMDKTVTECPKEWTHPNASYSRELRWRCDTYFAPITLNNTRYKNVFCAVCNGQTAANKDGIICRNSYYPVEQEFVLGLHGDLREGARIPGGSVDHCKPREMYNPFHKKCVKIACDKNCSYQGSTSLSYRSKSAVSSPCNMTVLKEGQFAIDNETNDLTINGTGIVYRKEEYEFGRRESETVVLLCLRESADSAPLFPQHYCERRTLLGYGSCGCENDCVRTRSCCLDSPAVVLNPSELADSIEADIWTCLPDVLSTSVIAKCRNFNSTDEDDIEVKNNCELNTIDPDNPLLIIPVFSVNDSNVYFNIYCAACNGATEVIFHDLHFLCAEHATYRNGAEAAAKFLSNKGLCALHTESPDPNLPVHFCVKSPDCKKCPESWIQNGTKNETGTEDADRRKLIKWQCNHSYAPVSVNGTCYRSEFCALCNGIDLSDPKIERRYYSDTGNRLPSFEEPRFTTFTIG